MLIVNIRRSNMAAGAIGVPQIIPLRPPKGCRRHVIDSVTEIELISETQDSLLYYTLNGRQPDPYQSSAKKYTFLYKEPFTVFPGKVTLKAVAVSRDGTRQSFVVSRTFTVHQGVLKRASVVTKIDQSSLQPPSLSQKFRQSLQMSLREDLKPVLSETMDTTHTLPLTTSPERKGTASFLNPAVSCVQSLKPLSCIYCLTPRVSSATDSFCTQCGAELPALDCPRVEDSDGRQSICPGCRAVLPSGTRQCVVCDGEVPSLDPIPTIKAQASTDTLITKDYVVCLECGTANPPHLTDCLTCGSLLPAPVSVGLQPPPSPEHTTVMHPIVGSSYMMCGTCGRVNVSDARYCDWCGSRPNDPRTLVTCHSCSTANKWQARFCHHCGSVVKCPLRPNVELAKTLHMTETQVEPNRWIPVTDRVVPKDSKGIMAKPGIKSCSTQTQGLFYPSAKSLSTKVLSEVHKQQNKSASLDRTKHLTEFSPGKGLWRMQIDHVCSHLKAHSQCSPDFQEEIGQKEIGKLISAQVKEEDLEEEKEEGHTLQLNLTFVLKGSSASDATNTYSTHMIGARRRCVSSNSSQVERRATSSAGTRKMSASLLRRSSSLAGIKAEDHLLAAELGSGGQGREDIVRNLLEKGADSNHVNQRGQPLLSLAACYGHIDSVAVLLNHGSRLDAQNKRTGDTALHEAVLRGPSHKDVVELLLKSGANPSLRNKDGLTVFELATRHHHPELVKLLTTHLGSAMLHTNSSTKS